MSGLTATGKKPVPSLRFLGTSDSQGVPRWWCSCSVCEEARTTGKNARTRPSAVIEGDERILLDAPPELRLQCSRERLTGFDAALLTHAHNDHILGLGDLADWGRWTLKDTRASCPIYMPAEVLPAVQTRFGYLLSDNYQTQTPFLPLEPALRTFAGYSVRAIRVPHGFNGFAYAFRFEQSGKAWGYMPDCLMLDNLDPWRDLELLVLGASFYQEPAPIAGRSIYDVTEAAALVQELKPGRTVLTHMGHGVDVRKHAPEGLEYAHDGLVIPLP